MNVSQHDLGQLSDNQVRAMVVDAAALVEAGGPAAAFYRKFATALARARRERRRILLTLEADALNDEDTDRGELVADDPELS